MHQYFYDRQIRRYIQQFIRLFSGFTVQMGVNDNTGLPIYQQVPVRYGDVNRMAAHITRENSENIANTVPFISCYVTSMDMAAQRRSYQQHVDKVQVFEKDYNETTGEYDNRIGNRYTIERYQPVPYNLIMNCDVWTSNTDQKLQLLEQIMVLFNPTLDVRHTNNPHDWSSLAYVEMTNSIWSSRSVGSSIDDIVDVSTLTFEMPIWINPPAKVKQQRIIHNIIAQLYSLDYDDFGAFEINEPFDTSTLQYTIVTFENRKMRYENGKAYLLNKNSSNLDDDGLALEWDKDLIPFGKLRPGISQIRMRPADAVDDASADIIGRLYPDESNPGALNVDIDFDSLPGNTLPPINAAMNPAKNYPGDGVVPTPAVGQRYLLMQDVPLAPVWLGLDAKANDIIEYNGVNWHVAFDASEIPNTHYLLNLASNDQISWNGEEWINSYEGIYRAGYWRLHL